MLFKMLVVFYEYLLFLKYFTLQFFLDSSFVIIKFWGYFTQSEFTVKYTGEQQYKNENRIVFNF